MSKPYLAVSELTDTIYIVDGKEKYDVSEEALNATRLTHGTIPLERMEQIKTEITAEVVSHSGTGDEVIQAYVDGLNYSLRVIDKALKEQNG